MHSRCWIMGFLCGKEATHASPRRCDRLRDCNMSRIANVSLHFWPVSVCNLASAISHPFHLAPGPGGDAAWESPDRRGRQGRVHALQRRVRGLFGPCSRPGVTSAPHALAMKSSGIGTDRAHAYVSGVRSRTDSEVMLAESAGKNVAEVNKKLAEAEIAKKVRCKA
eukprot:1630272-Rhodomonas_salina.2